MDHILAPTIWHLAPHQPTTASRRRTPFSKKGTIHYILRNSHLWDMGVTVGMETHESLFCALRHSGAIVHWGLRLSGAEAAKSRDSY